MADRVSASITLGGLVTAFQFAELAQLVDEERRSTESEGEAFEASTLIAGKPLRLYAYVALGTFEPLESWCREHGLPYVRWSGGYGGEWGPERVVFRGTGEPVVYDADENDRVFIDRMTVERLGSVDAILAHFEKAEFSPPPLRFGAHDGS